MKDFWANIAPIVTSLPFRLFLVLFFWRLALIIAKKIYKKTTKTKKTIKIDFQYACSRTIIGIIAFLIAIFQFETIQQGAGYVVTSTGLLVAVAGFCFQEALSNVIHGVILVMSEHFQVGDRISFTYDGEVITGIIRGMDMRCVKVENIITSSIHLVPNSVIDKNIVQNFHLDNKKSKNYQVVVQITYDSDIDLALETMQEVIGNLPQFFDTRTPEEIENGVPKVSVFVRNLHLSGVEIIGNVKTKSIDDNFAACSEARRILLKRFKEVGIEIAKPQMQII